MKTTIKGVQDIDCKSIDLSNLPKEKIFEEFKKILLQYNKPSIEFESMRKTNMLKSFPELKSLLDCPQDIRHHPEGSVWNHTMMVLDVAATLRSQSKHPLIFMLAALCHDLGKPLVTKELPHKIISYNHEKRGVEPTISFLSRLTDDTEIIQNVSTLVKEHMQPFLFYRSKDKISEKAFRKLAKRLQQAGGIHELLLLSEADRRGRAIDEDKKDFDTIRNFFTKKVSTLNLN